MSGPVPETRYARARDGAYIAYQTFGEGPVDLAWQIDWMANVDELWEVDSFRGFFESLAEIGRVIVHDRRSVGLSSRNVPVPDLETRVSDLLAVLEAAGAEQPILGGERDGGAPNALLAATRPDRVRSLVWYAPTARAVWAPDYPWGVGPAYVELERMTLEQWGTSGFVHAFIEQERSVGHEISEHDAKQLARLSRHTTTPDVAQDLARVWYETDVRPVLSSIRVPTLLVDFEDGSPDEVRYIASLIPDAQLVLVPGSEVEAVGNLPTIEAVREFLGVEARGPHESVLATVLFTDIVGSTQRQANAGDHGWRRVVEQHHRLVREALARWRGMENDTAGDGFYATFDGPARAIRCAAEIVEAVRPLGIEVRAGVHTGECEIVDGKHFGLTVSIGARVAAAAGPSEVLVTRTVKDLVAGGGFTFADGGEHALKGVPDTWQLYRVAT